MRYGVRENNVGVELKSGVEAGGRRRRVDSGVVRLG
jgi:hypothetical protein